MLFNTVIWYFFFYAVIGYLVEVTYCSVPQRKLVNRGFLYGPWLPIYGIGALLIIIGTHHVVTKPILVFFVTVFLTSAVEYIGGWGLERFFGLRLWDYSTYRFNFRGRICLRNSTLFGLLGLALVYGIHPAVQKVVAAMGERTADIGAHVIVLVFAIDTTASVLSMRSFAALLERYHLRKGEIEEKLASLASQSQARLLVERLKEERVELMETLALKSRSILSRFPSLTSQSEERKGHLRVVRERIEEILQERKKR